MSKSIAKAELAGTPVVYTPTMQFDASDVQLPRIRIAHHSSPYVLDGHIKDGALYSTVGLDDPDPQTFEQPLVVHVLGYKKGLSLSDNNDLQTWAWGDPAAPADAKPTFDYFVAVPTIDPTMAYKMLFKGSGLGAAKQMNTVLARTAGRGPQYAVAFEVTTKFQENTEKRFRWFKPVVRQVEATEEAIEIAAGLMVQVEAMSVEPVPSSTDAPRI